MSIAGFSIKRPVTTIMIYLGIIILGYIAWSRLPQELFPPITYPQLTVVTYYKDAAPEEIELLITKPIEEAVGTVSGVRRISSTSKEELSLVIADFNWGTNMDFAALGTREKIDLIKEALPRGSEEPIVMKFNPFELPIMILNITGKMPASELLDISRKIIKTELEKVVGVASCNLTGGVEREILIEVDQGRLAASGVSIIDIVDALSKANLNYPAGTIEEAFYEYLIRTIGEFEVISEMKDIAVGVDDRSKLTSEEQMLEETEGKEQKKLFEKRLILLKEIAKVKDTFKEISSISRYNGRENISLSIQKQAGSNTLLVANNVRRVLSQIKDELPKDIKIDIVYDQSSFIKSSITGVRDAAVQGGFLAFVVLLFFLRKWWSSLIITISIPISIMVVFALMYFTNISINIISLGGLALGVGMLVDAAIVVIENIYRHRQEGMSPKEAAEFGTQEVAGAIGGSVLTTIIVFLPMVFVIGIAGQLFKELAFTVTFSLLVSWIGAVTLVPLLATREKTIPKVELDQTKSPSLVERLLIVMDIFNHKALTLFLNHKFISLLLVFLIFIGSVFLFFNLNREFLPKIDQGQFVIKVNLPPGSKLSVTNSVVRKIERILFGFGEVSSITVNIGSAKEKAAGAVLETLGSHQAQVIVNLKPLYKGFRKKNIDSSFLRAVPTAGVIQRLKEALKQDPLEGAELEYIVQESVFKMAFMAGAPVVVEIKGQNLDTLKNLTKELQNKILNVDGIYGVRNSLVEPSPETKVYVMKERAIQYNLSVSDIALTAQAAIKGYVATKFKEAGREIDVRVRLRPGDRNEISKVRRLIVHSPLGIEVPLAEVAYLGVGKGPTEIKRLDQQRVALISTNIFKRGFSEVAQDINRIISGTKLPSGYSMELTGENLQMQESFTSLRFALILAITLVYMIMAAQFESLWQPFIILYIIPLSLIGVAIGLLITNTPVSVMVLLGFVILGGIVVDNGIVLIDYVNILRGRGMSAYDAVLLASKTRLRPILITSWTTILGLLPLSLGLAEGAELQQPMAITCMAGLTVSTFLSLVVIPTIYLVMENLLAKFRKAVVEEAPSIIIEKPPTPQPIPSFPIIPSVVAPPQPVAPPPRPPQYEPTALTERQQQILEYIKQHGRISRKECSDAFGISIPTAGRDLKDLVDKGLIVGKGPLAVGRYYELA